MAEKKARSLAERKEAKLAELAALEAKELVKYQSEFDAKTSRLAKLEELITKYAEERRVTAARLVELSTLIGELMGEDDDEDTTETPVVSSLDQS